MAIECSITESIGETDRAALYRGMSAGRPVLLKVLKPHPSPTELIRFEHELELASLLPQRSATRPLAMGTVEGRVALVLEYFAGKSLSRILRGPTELTRFLTIAIGVSSALADVHHTVVHRDLTPDRVLVDLEAHQVKLTGFGIASPIQSERHSLAAPSLFEGSLAYMSPEQTGRTNHPIDARSDLYSLGVVLYQLATGLLPFNGRDFLDWVHCHLARTPTVPRQMRPDLPPVLSDLILRLLAKAPEERYQTAAGVREDLERCLESYSNRGDIQPFPLGSRDVSDRFEIPPKLYGRKKERAALHSAFQRVVQPGTTSVFSIAGPAGAGKTALVRELQVPVVQTRSLFAMGKGDQYRLDRPYGVLGQACSALVRQVLTRTDEEIDHWHATLLESVGSSGRLITEIVPELLPVIGEQPPVVELPVSQAEARLFQVFWRFLNTFSSAEHPLVLFLDDLQWVDAASLRLLQHVVEDRDTRYLLLVCAYRPVGEQRQRSIEELRARAPEFEEVTLGGLSVPDINQLLQEALHHPLRDTSDLAALVRERTAGNPFYTVEFLTELYREGLFKFDQRTAAWSWDMARIRAKRATDNVVEFLIERLVDLPPTALELLRLAACMGGRFGAQRLGAIGGRSDEGVRRDLLEAIRRGLLVRSDGEYEFVHDRVQQAAYALIPERDRPVLHRRIGRLLAGDSPPASLGDEIFQVASHLIRGASAVTDAEERHRVAAIALEAGRRARVGTAYALAADYLSAGIALLDAASWDQHYATAYGLHFELSQCRYLTADPADAERLLTELFARARTRSEMVGLYRMKVEFSWLFDDLDGAIDAVLDCLRLFDVVLEGHPSAASAIELYEQAVSTRKSRGRIEDLGELPRTESSEVEQLLATLSTAFPCAYWYDENLHFSLSALAVRVAIEHGISSGAAHAFADFGMIIGARLGQYEDGYEFGRVAVDLVDGPGYEDVKPRVYMVFGGMTAHWTRPLADSSLLEKAFTCGVEAGDLSHAAISCELILEGLLGSSVRLDLVQERATSFRKFLEKTKFLAVEEVVACEERLIQSLRGDGEAGSVGWWRDTERRKRFRFGNAPYVIAQLQAAVLFGEEELAAELALEIAPIVHQIRGYFRVADYHFLSALALAARYPHVGADEQRRFRERLEVHRDLYAEWARLCPENFLARYALVRAEIAVMAGNDLEAIQRYEEAIAESRKAGSLSNEAMAYESASRFYRTRNMILFADTYLREARSRYGEWGAEGKVRSIDALHPQVREQPVAGANGVARPEAVDIVALATSLRAISSDINRSSLLTTTMRMLMQQAGADRAVFVSASAGEWRAEVEAVLAGELAVRDVPYSEGARVVPTSVIRRTSRLAEPYVVADAERSLADGGDGAYFGARHPRSILCVPVIRRGTVVGAIYLENHTLRGAFSPETIRTTELLASQVAISLETAELYGRLLKENARRRAGEAELTASRAQFESVFEHMVDGVITCDRAGRLTFFNRAFESLSGFPRSELGAATVGSLASAIRLGAPETAPFDERELPLRRALAGATCVDVPATLTHLGTGMRSDVRISSAPIIGAGGVPTGAVSILHDVTAAAQLELMKDQFIRVAAHELKTPVAILRIGAQRLMRATAAQKGEIHSTAELLGRGSDRIHRIVDAILLLSLLQKGRLELVQEDVDVAALVSQVANDAMQVHHRAIRLRTEPAFTHGDRERLKQILVHLIENAIRYSPGGEEVDVAVVRREREVLVHVRDHGVGIPGDKQAHIFERFFRAHADTPLDFGGMGVGLYLSREIARQHGGDIWFESAEGLGSAFHLSVPLLNEATSAHTG